jgi:putative Holliday junction resolvase
MSGADTEKLAGIDYGRRRIGIAVSDGLGITAQPLEQIEVNGFEDAVSRVGEVLMRENVTFIVYGLPMHMNGTVSEMGEEVKGFAESVSRVVDIPYDFFDERLTSEQAYNVLSGMKMSLKKKQKKVDKIAAQILLQSYMNFHRSQKTEHREQKTEDSNS